MVDGKGLKYQPTNKKTAIFFFGLLAAVTVYRVVSSEGGKTDAIKDKPNLIGEFNAYRAALLPEYRKWKELEGDALSNNVELASNDLEAAIAADMYKHSAWNEQFSFSPDISDEMRDATWSCRAAIEGMKSWLTDISTSHSQLDDKKYYYENATKCN